MSTKLKLYQHGSIIGLILILLVVFFNPFLFGEHSILRIGDTLDQILPLYEYYHHLLYSSSEFPFWSWESGVGANFWGSNAYYMTGDPFFYLSLLFPQNSFPAYFYIMTLLKFVLSGYFWYLFMRGNQIKYFPSLITSLIFTFSGWMIFFNLRYLFWGSIYVFIPLLLLGIDRGLTKKKWSLFIVTVFTLAVTNYYFFYMASILVALYFLYKYFLQSEISFKGFFKQLGALSLSYLIGLGMACFIFLPAAYAVFSNIRMGGGVPDFFQFYNVDKLKRIFLGMLDGRTFGVTFMALILIPQLVIMKSTIRSKLVHFFLIIVSCLLVMMPFFYSMLNGFSYETDRWYFILIALFLYMTGVVLDKVKDLHIGNSLLALVVFVLLGYFSFHYEQTLSEQLIFGAIILVLLVLYPYMKHGLIIKLLLLLVISVNLILNGVEYRDTMDYSTDTFFTEGEYFADHTTEAINYIEKQDSSFYRVTKNYTSFSSNDQLIQGYKGLSTYHSLANPGYLKLLEEHQVRMFGAMFNQPVGFDNRLSLEALFNTKYYLVKEDDNFVPFGYQFLKQVEDVKIYENQYVLPMAVGYQTYFAEDEFQSLAAPLKDQSLLAGVGLSKEEVSKLPIDLEKASQEDLHYSKKLIPIDEMEFTNVDVNRVNDTEAIITVREDGQIQLPVNLNKSGEYFLTYTQERENKRISNSMVVTDENGLWKKALDRSHRVYRPQENVALSLYSHDQLDDITLRFTADNSYQLKDVSIYVLDEEYYVDRLNELQENALEDVEVTNNTVTGSLSLQNDQMMFFAIPYDAGWKAQVDQKDVPVYSLSNGFVGVPVKKGTHTVELNYVSPWFYQGLGISIFSLLLFVAYSILSRRKKKNRSDDSEVVSSTESGMRTNGTK